MERAVYALAAAIVLAALILGGVYDTTTAGGELSGVFRVNRFTGQAAQCNAGRCKVLYDTTAP